MLKSFLLTVMMIAILTTSLAWPAGAADSESYTTDPRSNLSTVFYTGVGGAVLGLSTLSFYGRPQDHMANIAIGFAVGIIFGASYVTIETAHRPSHADLIPQAETELALNSARQSPPASELMPAQWSWSF